MNYDARDYGVNAGEDVKAEINLMRRSVNAYRAHTAHAAAINANAAGARWPERNSHTVKALRAIIAIKSRVKFSVKRLTVS